MAFSISELRHRRDNRTDQRFHAQSALAKLGMNMPLDPDENSQFAPADRSRRSRLNAAIKAIENSVDTTSLDAVSAALAATTWLGYEVALICEFERLAELGDSHGR